jgi:hypothetical protein
MAAAGHPGIGRGHAKQVHQMDLSREQALAMAKPA